MKLIDKNNFEIPLTLANILENCKNFEHSLFLSEINSICNVSNSLLKTDYSRSIKEYICLGRYVWKSDLVNSNNFICQNRSIKTKPVLIEMLAFNYDVNADIVLNVMKERSLRPTTIYELLEFGLRFKDFQKILPVVSLGSIYVDKNGSRYVPTLSQRHGERKIGVNWYIEVWKPGTCFLTVRK